MAYKVTTFDYNASGRIGMTIQEDIAPTLKHGGGDGRMGVMYEMVHCIDTSFTNTNTHDDTSPCLNCRHDHPVILDEAKEEGRRYVVRKLTPTECCRLQGFPDGWGKPEIKDDMDDEEADFWENVRREDAEAKGKTYKHFGGKQQLVRWYNKLYSESNEYRMWGNGIALPCAAYVLRKIADNEEQKG